MSKPAHEHHERRGGHPAHGASRRRSPHKDWRLWLVVIVMLGAMGMYVMSLNEEVQPQAPPQPSTSAAK